MLESISFTKRYILALTIIALLSTLAYFNLTNLISSQANDGRMIQLSERQKLLAQKIALAAIYYKIKDLQENMELMEKSHAMLLQEEMSSELKKVYFEAPISLNRKVEEFLAHAQRFHIHRDGRSQNFLLRNAQSIADEFDKAVGVYLVEADAKTKQLKKVELSILIFTLLTLFLEAIFIFRPADKSIYKKTKELIAEKDYSNAVIESSTNAIITLDGNLKIRTYNKMAEIIFGYTKEEMPDMDALNKIIPSRYHGMHAQGVQEFFKTMVFHHYGEVLEFEAVNKHGEEFPVRMSFGASGDTEDIAIVANIQDISKEKLKDKVMQQQAKFAALGEMIAVIAHQWRQPLAELNFNNMYIKKKQQDAALHEELQKNEEIIKFMSETIANFEDFYKKTDNSLFHPTLSIDQALRLVESVLHLKQIKLTKSIMTDRVIYGNHNSLAHVVLSIVQNMIDVIKQRDVQEPMISIELYEEEQQMILRIKDNAGGIMVEPIEDIFKPFNSKKKVPSTGIGLYMSKLVITDKFHGTITAQNCDDGAEFIITLPL